MAYVSNSCLKVIIGLFWPGVEVIAPKRVAFAFLAIFMVSSGIVVPFLSKHSLPASASIKSELPAGNRVQLLEQSGEWYLLRFGETEGWCEKGSVAVIK